MASLLYGAGLRLMEYVRLRVKDIDCAMRQIVVRDGKGGKDRVTVLPDKLIAPLQLQLEKARTFHESDLEKGFGEVYLPYTLAQKYPNAPQEWSWQYAFRPTDTPLIRVQVSSGATILTRKHCSVRCAMPCAQRD